MKELTTDYDIIEVKKAIKMFDNEKLYSDQRIQDLLKEGNLHVKWSGDDVIDMDNYNP